MTGKPAHSASLSLKVEVWLGSLLFPISRYHIFLRMAFFAELGGCYHMQHPSCPVLRLYPGYGGYSVHFCYLCGQLLDPAETRYEAKFNFITGKKQVKKRQIHFPKGSNYPCRGERKLLVGSELMAERVKKATAATYARIRMLELLRDVMCIAFIVAICWAFWPVVHQIRVADLAEALWTNLVALRTALSEMIWSARV
jgi:hypothetical protein